MPNPSAVSKISQADFWDSHWTEKLEDKFWRRISQISFHAESLMEFLPLFRERKVQQVLLPGNGCSLLPHAFVHCGFNVTVLDFSSVANNSVKAVKPTPELLACFLPVRKPEHSKSNVWVIDKEASLQRVEAEAVSGGTLTFVAADLLEWTTNAPFDLIYDDRTAMLFPKDAWGLVAARYAQWLNPDSLCFIETINFGGMMGQDVSPTRNPFEQAFHAAGFDEYEFYVRTDYEPMEQPRRRFWDRCRPQPPVPVSVSSRSVRMTAPPPGGRQICFWHGSG